jgi:hypothetical protein
MDQRPKCNTQHQDSIRGKRRETLEDAGTDFLNMTPKTQETKQK